MAFEQYRANVQALCNKLGIQNPIREQDLRILSLKFHNASGEPLVVEATEMNRAGRLFIQANIPNIGRVRIRSQVDEAAKFFTPEMWEDCGREKRPLIYGLKTAEYVEISYKELKCPCCGDDGGDGAKDWADGHCNECKAAGCPRKKECVRQPVGLGSYDPGVDSPHGWGRY